MNRRTFLTGLMATAAGLLVPADVAATPERRVWALDATMLGRRSTWSRWDFPFTDESFLRGGAVVDFSDVEGPIYLSRSACSPGIWQLAVDDASCILPGPIVIDNEWMHVISRSTRQNTIAVVRRMDSPLA